MTASIITPAKINLYLKITGKRPDNYHELKTLFLPLNNPSDKITIDFDSDCGIKISCNEPSVPVDENNICYKAAQQYAERTGIKPAWNISIDKQIPVAAGLGGGSSDAAAVLRVLNAHYQKLSTPELAEIAVKLGADVPFFLEPIAKVASGIGEIFEIPTQKIPTPPILLLNALFPVSARWCYKNLAKEAISIPTEDDLTQLLEAAAAKKWELMAKYIHNDLSAANYKKFPLLTIIREFLLANGSCGVEISGSGPTIFAIMPNFASLTEIYRKCKEKFPEYLIFTTLDE